jgi:hypothetical protein
MTIPLIDEYNWQELEQAYGSAENAPKFLNDLLSGDEDLLDEAINDFLFSQACHQYTTYSCTPPVVKCVVFILNNYELDSYIINQLLQFIHACTYNAVSIPELRKEILLGLNCYKVFEKHPDEKVELTADSLINFCSTYGG